MKLHFYPIIEEARDTEDGKDASEIVNLVANVLASESKRRNNAYEVEETTIHDKFYDELFVQVHCPFTLFIDKVFKLFAQLWFSANIWKFAEEADWVIVNDYILFDVINTLEFKGSVDKTVEFIAGGVAKVKPDEILTPAVLAN